MASRWQPGDQLRLGVARSPIILGQRLGSGAQAEVFELVDGKRELAYKLYFAGPPADLPSVVAHSRTNLVERIYHIADGVKAPIVAAPRSLIYTPGDTMVGVASIAAPKSFSMNVETFMRSVRKRELAQAVEAGQGVAASVQRLHEAKYVLGDTSPNNFLVDGSGHVVCVDIDSFGFTSDSGVERKAGQTTLHYRSPATIHGSPTQATDDFAVGVIVLQLVLGVHPFGGRLRDGSKDSIQANIFAGKSWLIDREEFNLQPSISRHPGLESLSPALRAVAYELLVKDARLPPPTTAAWASALASAIPSLENCSSCGSVKFGGAVCGASGHIAKEPPPRTPRTAPVDDGIIRPIVGPPAAAQPQAPPRVASPGATSGMPYTPTAATSSASGSSRSASDRDVPRAVGIVSALGLLLSLIVGLILALTGHRFAAVVSLVAGGVFLLGAVAAFGIVIWMES